MTRLDWVGWLGALANSDIGRRGVSLLWRQGRRLPLAVVAETETLLAFHHPRPSHVVHIVIVPKRPLRSLLALDPHDTVFLTDLVAVVQKLVRTLALEADGYRLISNGGPFQTFPYLHFHLVSGKV